MTFRSSKKVFPVDSTTSGRGATNSFDDEEISQHIPARTSSVHSDINNNGHNKSARKYVITSSSPKIGVPVANDGVSYDEKSCESNHDQQISPRL